MKLYISNGIVWYEGTKTIGVFSSREKAQKAYDDHQIMAKKADSNTWVFDECEIIETNLDARVIH